MRATLPSLRAAKREARRLRLVAGIPSWYDPWAHLALNLCLNLAVTVFAAAHLHRVTLRQWATVPVLLAAANAFEWAAHRWPMHLSRPWSHSIYQRHAAIHHTLFVAGDMGLRSWRELRFVLVHPLDLVGLLVVLVALAATWALLTSVNGGLVAGATLALYVVFYELSHMLYHWPAGRGWSRVTATLRRHHAVHHYPPLMSHWNFNVTVPLFDWLCGTRAPGKLVPPGRGA